MNDEASRILWVYVSISKATSKLLPSLANRSSWLSRASRADANLRIPLLKAFLFFSYNTFQQTFWSYHRFLSVRWRIALRSSTPKGRSICPKVKLSAYRQEMWTKSFGSCWNASDQSEKFMMTWCKLFKKEL